MGELTRKEWMLLFIFPLESSMVILTFRQNQIFIQGEVARIIREVSCFSVSILISCFYAGTNPGPQKTSEMESFTAVDLCYKGLHLRCLRGPGCTSGIFLHQRWWGLSFNLKALVHSENDLILALSFFLAQRIQYGRSMS